MKATSRQCDLIGLLEKVFPKKQKYWENFLGYLESISF